MKNKIFTVGFLVLVVGAFLASCKVPSTGVLPSGQFSLKVGEMRQVGPGASVQFVGVESDSRCPLRVTCVWAGEVTASVKVTIGGVVSEKKLVKSATVDESRNTADFTVDGKKYRLKLVDVTPYPEVQTPKISPSEYVARFEIKF